MTKANCRHCHPRTGDRGLLEVMDRRSAIEAFVGCGGPRRFERSDTYHPTDRSLLEVMGRRRVIGAFVGCG